MKRFAIRSCAAAVWLFFGLSARAHDLPLSYIDLRLTSDGIEATVESSAKNFARELGEADEASLLDDTKLKSIQTRIASSVASGFTINALPPTLRVLEPLPARRDLRLQFHFPVIGESEALEVQCQLFAADPRHKTFLNIYRGDALAYQGIFDRETTRIVYRPREKQNPLAVIRQFLLEGVHHIFIGPDHILFIIGLLLLGGSLGQLLKIVTAFTVAHSITLALATLNILSPPARVIEPMIALSIIFVGAHALLLGREEHDWRLLFAFCFGFIHGFGFANVLREMQLPRAALGWSLLSFNLGVEIGQACIVLAVAPALALLHRRNPPAARRVVAAAAFGVVFAGSFWFTQRLF